MGNRIREIRKSRGITQKRLSDFLGVSECAVSYYESGKRQPDNDTLMKIASFLGSSVDELLGFLPKKSDSPFVVLNVEQAPSAGSGAPIVVTAVRKEKSAPSEDGADAARADDSIREYVDQLTPENREKLKSYMAFLLSTQENP